MAIRPSDLNGPDSLPSGRTQPAVTPDGFPDPQSTSVPREPVNPEENLTDDPLEAQLAEAFLNNEVDDTDPGEPGVPGEPPAEPAAEPEGQPPADDDTPAEDEDEGSPTDDTGDRPEDDGADQEAVLGGDESEEDDEGGDEDDPILVELDDTQYTQSEVTEALELLQWRNNMQLEERQAIQAIYDPNYRIVEVNTLSDYVDQQVNERLEELSKLQPQQQQPSDDDEFLDPRAAQEIARLNQELSELKGTVTTTQQQAEQEAALRLNQEIEAGRNAFQEAYADLSTDDIARIEQAATQLNIVPALAQQGRPIHQAVKEGMEVAWRNMPEYQQQVIDRQLEEERKARKATDAKKKKAAKVGGSNGSVSRKRRAPSTREERDQAMVDEIAEAIQQGR